MTKIVCDLKPSNSHSLSLWQCLVVYLLEFKICLIKKTMDILNIFTTPSLVCIKQVVPKPATVYISRQRIKTNLIRQKHFLKIENV